MHLSSEAIESLTERLPGEVLQGFEAMPAIKQEFMRVDLMDIVLPVLQELPDGLPVEELIHQKPFFEAQAVTLLLRRLRRTMIWRDASDEALLESLTEEVIIESALRLYALVSISLQLLDGRPSISELLEGFDGWDAEAELERLLEEE